jgi:hypothetical protein
MNGIFIIFIFLPSIALGFVVLAVFYDYVRAYIALSWVPITFYILIGLLNKLEFMGHKPGHLSENLTEVIVWISLLQFLFGIGLAGYSIWKKQNVFGLLLASGLVVIPFVWWMMN